MYKLCINKIRTMMHFDVLKKKAFLIRSIITSITGEELKTSGRLQSGAAVSLNHAAVIL